MKSLTLFGSYPGSGNCWNVIIRSADFADTVLGVGTGVGVGRRVGVGVSIGRTVGVGDAVAVAIGVGTTVRDETDVGSGTFVVVGAGNDVGVTAAGEAVGSMGRSDVGMTVAVGDSWPSSQEMPAMSNNPASRKSRFNLIMTIFYRKIDGRGERI